MASISKFEQKFMKLQFSGKDRLRMYRKLGRFLNNGISVPDALYRMWHHASHDGKKPKTVQAVVLDSWLAQVKEGKRFGVAIQDWVPLNDRIVIEAGEAAGRLPEALENACLLYESQTRIRGAVISGVTYPIALIGVAIGLMVMFGTEVIPAFDEALPREQWTGQAAQMAGLADFVNTGLWPTVGAVVAVLLLIVWSMPRWTGPLRARLDAYPPYSIYRLMAGSGFLLSMGALVKAGVQITEVLRIMQRSASPWLAERVGKTLSLVNNGQDIGEALYTTRLNFPDRETVNDLRTYAKLEGFDEMLMKLGKENLDEAVAKIQAQSSVLRNVGIVILGVVFAFIATGIFALPGQVTAGAM